MLRVSYLRILTYLTLSKVLILAVPVFTKQTLDPKRLLGFYFLGFCPDRARIVFL